MLLPNLVYTVMYLLKIQIKFQRQKTPFIFLIQICLFIYTTPMKFMSERWVFILFYVFPEKLNKFSASDPNISFSVKCGPRQSVRTITQWRASIFRSFNEITLKWALPPIYLFFLFKNMTPLMSVKKRQ